MKLKTIAKGVIVVSAVGTAYYMVSNASPKQRRHMKRAISHGMRNFGNMCNDFSYIM